MSHIVFRPSSRSINVQLDGHTTVSRLIRQLGDLPAGLVLSEVYDNNSADLDKRVMSLVFVADDINPNRSFRGPDA